MSAIVWKLEERCLIRVSGADAAGFLQNLVTQDVVRLTDGQMAYSCLLTPQGRFLHDFFISRDAEGFFLECETARREDLIRRLNVFRLRAKVAIEDWHGLFDVYASTILPEDISAFPDPRLTALGYRFYLPAGKPWTGAAPSAAYKDMRIRLGVPEGSPEIKPEVDTLADVDLDILPAVSWDKGCYVGQEVTARMKNRSLVKKRMMIVSGSRLTAGDALTCQEQVAGEMRAVDSSRTLGLAIVKLAFLETGSFTHLGGAIISVRLPDWMRQNT